MDLSSVLIAAIVLCAITMVVVIGGSYIAYKVKNNKTTPYQIRN